MSKGMKRPTKPYPNKTREIRIPSGDGLLQEFMLPERIGENLNPVLKEVERLSNRLYSSFKGVCLIPKLPQDKEHDEMNNCHWIGEKFLNRLLTNGSMYYWPVAHPYHIAFLTRHEGGGMLGYKFPWEIKSIPHKSAGPGDALCKLRSACHNHDHDVFEIIDDPEKFHPEDIRAQYLLGLRAMVSNVALADSALEWALANGQTGFIVEDAIENLEYEKEAHFRELQHWLEIRERGSFSAIASLYMKVSTSIRMAASDVIEDESSGLFFTVSILPGRDVKELDVIVSSRKTPKLSLVSNIQQKIAFHRIARTISLLSKNPTAGIVGIMDLTPRMFVCPQDYDAPSILGEEDRAEIDRVAANIYKKAFEHSPISQLPYEIDPP